MQTAVGSTAPAGGRLLQGLRAVSAGAIAGAICGLIVGGGGGRLAMRVVALASSTTLAFDRSASLQLLRQVTFRGVTLGVIFMAIRGRLPKWRWGPTETFAGILVLFMLAAALLSPWRAEFRQGPLWLGLLLFALVVGVYGITTGWLAVRLDSLFARAGDGVPQRLMFGALAALGLVMGLLGLLSIALKDLIAGS